ncbi:MAG: enoyl-CoA hydratase/isomerase family protein, partial [Hyphomicrobiaceae bacterium]
MVDVSDLGVTVQGRVALVEIQRPPHNFFDYALIKKLADTFEELDQNDACRAIVLCAEGKSFCAGANFGDGSRIATDGSTDTSPNTGADGHLYVEAVRLFTCKKPIVGAIQGAAVGGGLGLSLVPDFRVGCPETRFAANFTRLGFHPGFGLTVTLPRLIGDTRASLMFYTSRRVRGEEAYRIGLLDEFVALPDVREKAVELAQEISENAPLALIATRQTMRRDLADKVRAATDHELKEQMWL